MAAWGENLRGQLGQGATSSGSTTPVSVNAAPSVSALSGKTVTAVAAGTYHSLALCSDGSLAARGNNDNSQLGDNTSTQRAAPVAVNTTSGISALHGRLVEAIAVGSVHSLALCSDGTVAAWGYNGSGQLGNAGLILHRAPVEVSAAAGSSALAGRSVTSITAGSSPGVFVRRKDRLLIGLTYTVQFSADLAQWQSSAEQPFVLADDGTHEVVSVPFPVLSGGVKPCFFRIHLSVSP